MVGKVVKLDYNTDSRTNSRFARMAVYVNLDKPLTSQVLINGTTQLIEYESLWMIQPCERIVSKGRHGHVLNWKKNGDIWYIVDEIQHGERGGGIQTLDAG
ncbi:hypothetical protein Gorai_016643 [Gossypium raimondii]|uniref:Uncharacterized protein n=1 Tax=Gossypium raimondii TaxID=29730 RepID=A0A7J8PAF9_GOSRA|nr:hypothetical protein [Gossypium raimondii]